MARFFAKPQGVALGSGEWRRVSIILWWPGRDKSDYDSATGGYDDLPEKFKSLVRRCIGSGSKYLAYATVRMPDGSEVYGYSRCMDIDNPVRSYAVNKAVGFLQKHLGDEEWLASHGVTCKDRFAVVKIDERGEQE